MLNSLSLNCGFNHYIDKTFNKLFESNLQLQISSPNNFTAKGFTVSTNYRLQQKCCEGRLAK